MTSDNKHDAAWVCEVSDNEETGETTDKAANEGTDEAAGHDDPAPQYGPQHDGSYLSPFYTTVLCDDELHSYILARCVGKREQVVVYHSTLEGPADKILAIVDSAINHAVRYVTPQLLIIGAWPDECFEVAKKRGFQEIIIHSMNSPAEPHEATAEGQLTADPSTIPGRQAQTTRRIYGQDLLAHVPPYGSYINGQLITSVINPSTKKFILEYFRGFTLDELEKELESFTTNFYSFDAIRDIENVGSGMLAAKNKINAAASSKPHKIVTHGGLTYEVYWGTYTPRQIEYIKSSGGANYILIIESAGSSDGGLNARIYAAGRVPYPEYIFAKTAELPLEIPSFGDIPRRLDCKAASVFVCPDGTN